MDRWLIVFGLGGWILAGANALLGLYKLWLQEQQHNEDYQQMAREMRAATQAVKDWQHKYRIEAQANKDLKKGLKT